MNELEKLRKKFRKLEKEYAKADGKPLRQKRILRQAHAVEVLIQEVINRLPEIQKGGIGVKMERRER